MKFTTATVTMFLSIATALPEPRAAQGMVQILDTRDVSLEKTVFGRSISCPSNDPNTCCACRGGFGTCINGVCFCQGGDC